MHVVCVLCLTAYYTYMVNDAVPAHGSNLTAVSLTQASMFAEGSEPGDAIFLEGQTPGTAYPKTLKSDFWKKIVPELKVQSSTACCAAQKLVTLKGAVHLPPSMPDGAGIH